MRIIFIFCFFLEYLFIVILMKFYRVSLLFDGYFLLGFDVLIVFWFFVIFGGVLVFKWGKLIFDLEG